VKRSLREKFISLLSMYAESTQVLLSSLQS
jgi:hypothetical protein